MLVDEPFDFFDLLARDRREVQEVEAQAIGCDQRSGLLDVRPQYLPQCGVE